MREYSFLEVYRKLHSAERFFLVDTLPRASYANRHLPGALSLPLEEVAARAAEVLPDRHAEVIAYCSSPT